jgi:hypothetical protein
VLVLGSGGAARRDESKSEAEMSMGGYKRGGGAVVEKEDRARYSGGASLHARTVLHQRRRFQRGERRWGGDWRSRADGGGALTNLPRAE